jgi:hypothetical protein
MAAAKKLGNVKTSKSKGGAGGKPRPKANRRR